MYSKQNINSKKGAMHNEWCKNENLKLGVGVVT